MEIIYSFNRISSNGAENPPKILPKYIRNIVKNQLNKIEHFSNELLTFSESKSVSDGGKSILKIYFLSGGDYYHMERCLRVYNISDNDGKSFIVSIPDNMERYFSNHKYIEDFLNKQVLGRVKHIFYNKELQHLIREDVKSQLQHSFEKSLEEFDKLITDDMLKQVIQSPFPQFSSRGSTVIQWTTDNALAKDFANYLNQNDLTVSPFKGRVRDNIDLIGSISKDSGLYRYILSAFSKWQEASEGLLRFEWVPKLDPQRGGVSVVTCGKYGGKVLEDTANLQLEI